MNGASGTSDIEGKAARVEASEAGAERVSTPMDTNEDRQIRVYSCVLVVEKSDFRARTRHMSLVTFCIVPR